MREVEVAPVQLDRLLQLLVPDRAERLASQAAIARELLKGKVVWNVNSTARGGGVAEMLEALVAYARGARVDARWLTLSADQEFFTITKRVHNLLHGVPGDGGGLGEAERAHVEEVLATNLVALSARVRPGDIVLLHDPQTAGLVEGVRRLGALVLWRCHIGRDTPNSLTDKGWRFLRNFIFNADGFIFSRAQYAPDWMPPGKTWVIPPSLDPFTAKNIELDVADVAATLGMCGLIETDATNGGSLRFAHRDGTPGQVRKHRDLLRDGGGIPDSAQLVLQVSRWDRLKDPLGVLRGFVEHIDEMPPSAHLLLAGPDVTAVTDDPEGATVLAECLSAWRKLPSRARERTHLACLPVDDVDENAHVVNALQRHATVVVQKSLVEGFGLTVAEPMWKARPVVASAVGGIRDQIEDGVSGILVSESNLGGFGKQVQRLLYDEEWATRLGIAARARIQDRFLGDRHLIQYVDMFASLLVS